MILLDTNALIDLPRDELLTDMLGASILSRAKLEFGIRIARTDAIALARAEYLAALDKLVDWIPFDDAASRAYGYLAAAMHRDGATGRARKTDTFIAAQAHALGVPLLTRNVDDFARVAHLVQIIDPGPAA
ncbi:PIN domain-containing protein [Agromyces sp. NPDC055520]